MSACLNNRRRRQVTRARWRASGRYTKVDQEEDMPMSVFPLLLLHQPQGLALLRLRPCWRKPHLFSFRPVSLATCFTSSSKTSFAGMSSPSNKISNGHSLTCPLPDGRFRRRATTGLSAASRTSSFDSLTAALRARNAANNCSSRRAQPGAYRSCVKNDRF
jgi:hypothetical protein